MGTALLLVLLTLSVAWSIKVTREFKNTKYATSALAADPSPAGPSLAQPVARPAIFYKAITDRPLFSPSRRPEKAGPSGSVETVPVTPSRDAPQNAPAFVLKGTMVIGNTASALVGLPDTPADWVTPGSVVSGWTVTKVDAESAELSLDSNIVRVDLYPK